MTSPAVPDEPSTAAPNAPGVPPADPPVGAGQEARHRAVVPDVHDPLGARLRLQDQPEPQAAGPQDVRR